MSRSNVTNLEHRPNTAITILRKARSTPGSSRIVTYSSQSDSAPHLKLNRRATHKHQTLTTTMWLTPLSVDAGQKLDEGWLWEILFQRRKCGKIRHCYSPTKTSLALRKQQSSLGVSQCGSEEDDESFVLGKATLKMEGPLAQNLEA